ncbi:MAG: glycoside hydrolase family 88 protein [Verrucomicrobia bacterium]|nr:glycoside hydrolase family 88 protein [Verrucomicrobiota bacterium]MBV8641979.1 glycoside hydrolase family 88 protein [Verrucomicrobiota bacterium]
MNATGQSIFPDRIRAAFAFAGSQLRRLVTEHPDYFPLYTENGKWKHESEAWTNWCEGFLGGMLWILYRQTGDAWWREQAEHYSRLIEHRKTDRNVHDLGFLFLPTWKAWYELTQDSAKNQVVIDAGKTLALRFQPKGGYLRSFLAPDSLFIDIMMNVGIIFYAAQQTNDSKLWQVATDHCLTTRRFLVRGDGSTSHEGLFSSDTGEFVRQTTHQGWRNDSSWARGLTWALYGFTTAYQFTQDERFLDTSERCAKFYLDRTPAHGIPPNDWEEPEPRRPYESSAAAIAAAGLLELARTVSESAKADYYRERAFAILVTLMSPEFLASETPGWEGILKHGIYHERKGLGVDESVMWGEYFFLAALDKALADLEAL